MPVETMTPTTWTIDTTHTEIGFRVRHMMVSWTKGRFGAFSGIVTLDEAHPERSRIDLTIDAASVETGLDPRDEHLRSADFLDVEHHPHITFRSTSVRKVEEGAFTVVGDLALRGVARPVTLEVQGLGPRLPTRGARSAAVPRRARGWTARSSGSSGTASSRRAASSSATRCGSRSRWSSFRRPRTRSRQRDPGVRAGAPAPGLSRRVLWPRGVPRVPRGQSLPLAPTVTALLVPVLPAFVSRFRSVHPAPVVRPLRTWRLLLRLGARATRVATALLVPVLPAIVSPFRSVHPAPVVRPLRTWPRCGSARGPPG